MDFEPKTWVYFCKTGIDDFNKVVCKDQNELYSISAGGANQIGVMSDTSFQRADGYFTVRVDHSDIPYYKLMQADTVLYRNDETDGNFWIWCNIVGVDWKNPDCSFVRFKIDHFMTYQDKIDWDSTYAFIEREHIKDDWASDGGNPLFSNMGPAEDFGTVADTPFYTWVKGFSPDWVIVMSPYDGSGEAVFDGQVRGNLYTSLQIDILSPSEANDRFKQIAEKKTASINNIVGVYGCPQEWARIIRNGGFPGGFGGGNQDTVENIPAVNVAGKQLPSMPEYNNAKCWSSPFINIRLMSSEGSTVDFTPQWMGNDIDEYTIRYRAAGSGGMFGGAQCTFENKNGAFNWKAWNDFIVSLSQLPNCPWTGDGFTDWAAVNLAPTIWQHFANVTKGFSGTVAGGISAATKPSIGGAANVADSVVNLGIDSVSSALNTASTIMNQKASGATVNGIGSFNNLLDVADEAWGFKVVYYCTQIYTMLSVDAYFDRFGYRINKLKKLELENRPIWTFIKTAECHVISKTGIPYLSERSINQMFNHGVTMWKLDKYRAGTMPGDFSKAHDNRGIKG